MITIGTQIRAARALLGLSQTALARQSLLHENAVAYWEKQVTLPKGAEPYAVGNMRIVLESLGVVFIGERSPGVRLRRRGKRRSPICGIATIPVAAASS